MTAESLRHNFQQRGIVNGLLFYLGRGYTQICLCTMRLFLIFFPHAKSVIVFKNDPHADFSDNTRALFEYLMDEGYDRKYRMVWCVSNPKAFQKRYPDTVRFVTSGGKYDWNSFLTVYYCSVAKYFFYTHNTGGLHKARCKEQILVNLWHGNGYKASDSVERKSRKSNHVFDYALVSGSLFVDTKAEFWHCRREQLLTLGFPRYDWMLSANNKKEILWKIFGRNVEDKKVILWMPTYLQHNNFQFAEASVDAPLGFSGMSNLDELLRFNVYCRSQGVICIIKRHPAQSVWKNDDNLDAVWFLDDRQIEKAELQLSMILGSADALLTDYSSAAVDFLLLDRPIGFVLTDFEAYQKTRGFVFENPVAFMPGEKIYSYKDLQTFVNHVANGVDCFRKERQKMKQIMHEPTENYRKRIVEYLNM